MVRVRENEKKLTDRTTVVCFLRVAAANLAVDLLLPIRSFATDEKRKDDQGEADRLIEQLHRGFNIQLTEQYTEALQIKDSCR